MSRHGMYHSRPYGIWTGMKRRCYNKNDPTFKRYGAKGITMSKAWKESFSAFWEDMKDTYFDTASIDRINSKKGYSKGNCRWATKSQQNQNRKTVKLFTYKGRQVTLGGLEKELGLQRGRLYHRVNRMGWSIEKAIETKTMPYINNLKN